MRPIQNDFFALSPDMGNNPQLLVSLLCETIEVSAPVYIQPIIEQGIADGSIETDYPAELAELVILVANLWMNPMVFGRSEEAACRKFIVFGQMMKGMGKKVILDRPHNGFFENRFQLFQSTESRALANF